MRGSRDRPTSAAAYSYPTAAPQPARQYLQRGDLQAAPLITAGHALQIREQHATQQQQQPSAAAPRDARPTTATASLQSSSGNKYLFAQSAAPQQTGQAHSASIKRPSSGTAAPSYAAATYPASNSSLVSPAMLAAGASHSIYNSGSISAAAAGPSGAAAQPMSSSVLAAAAATGRRQVLAAGAAAAVAASSGTAAIPAPSQQQHRAVNAIREQLHQLSVSAAAAPPRTSPTHSPLPGLSPRNSSDGGSDDGLSDMAPSPSPSPLAMQRARTASAVSARHGERAAFPARNDPPGQRSYAFTPSESESQAALARGGGRGIAGPLITASLEPFQPSPSPSPPAPASATLSSPSPSPSPPSRFCGDAQAPLSQSMLQHKSAAAPGSSSLHETVIHVCDENRGIQQDFRCDRALLVAGMRYFAAYLTVPSNHPGTSSPPDDIDISVHCDVLIFEWLLLWIAWERSVGLYDAMLGPSKPVAASKAKLTAASKPSLDVNNVVSILISSDFLGMVRLVDECLSFVAANLSAVVRTPVDLACLSDELVRTMVNRHLNDEIDGSVEAMRRDTDDSAAVGHSRKHSAVASSPLAGLQLLCSLRDRKSKIAPRLWMFKTEALLAARSGAVGAASSSSLQQCAHCSELFWTSSSSDSSESLQFCASPLSRSRIDFHGVLHSKHVASRAWSARKWLLSLRVAESAEWEEIYWRVFGIVHSTPSGDDTSACCCEECGAKGFSYAALRSCRFHDKEAVMMKPAREAGSAVASPAPQLTYPCCGTPAGLFASSGSAAGAGGCRLKVHSMKPRGRKARALHEMALQHVDQICPLLPAAADVDGAVDPAASPSASSKKRVNIVLANNQTQSFGPGASTIKPASSIATAAAAAPAILGPSVAAALASYSADAAPSSKSATPAVRRSLSARRARALRGLDPDAPSDDDVVASSDDRSSAGSASEDDDDEDEEYEDDEEEDSDSDAGRRRRGGARPAAIAKSPAARAAAAAERLRFKPGYESSNPHGHAPKRPASQVSQRQQQQLQSQGRGSAHFESTAPIVQLKLNSLAEKALAQLRDVMTEAQFQLLHDQLLAGQQQQMQQQHANRTAGVGLTSQSSSSASIKPRAPSATGSIRVASRKTHQASVSHKPSQPHPARAVKSILKSPNGGAEVHIPSAAASSSLHAFSAWDASSGGAGVSRSPDGSPPRSPSKPKVRSSYALDSAFEDDRQRMASIISELTQSRGAQQQAQVTNAAAAAAAASAAHGRSASAAPPSRMIDRGSSAQARRPYK